MQCITSATTAAHNHRRATAQPCVNGDRLSRWRMAKFDRPHADKKPRDRSTQNLKQVIASARQPLRKISCKSIQGLIGKWVKYYENFSTIYIYLFCWPIYTG